MRLWGDKSDDAEAAEPAAEVQKPSLLEASLMKMLTANPQFGEAVGFLLKAVKDNQEQQQEILQKVRDIHLWMTQERALRLGSAKSQLRLEGVVSDGEHCPACGATGDCECFAGLNLDPLAQAPAEAGEADDGKTE